MFFEFQITVPANTPKDDPITQKLELKPGVIHKIGIYFPPGCCCLVHVQLWHLDVPLWPTNPEGDICGDAQEVFWLEHYALWDKPAELIAKAWNEDEKFDHRIIIRIAILPPPGMYPWLRL